MENVSHLILIFNILIPLLKHLKDSSFSSGYIYVCICI